jgi:hypothetical protein
VELDADVLMRVGRFLERQGDLQADAQAVQALPGALVGRLHDAGATAGNDRNAHLRRRPRQLDRLAVVMILRANARATEDRDCRWQQIKQTLGVAKLLVDQAADVAVPMGGCGHGRTLLSPEHQPDQCGAGDSGCQIAST